MTLGQTTVEYNGKQYKVRTHHYNGDWREYTLEDDSGKISHANKLLCHIVGVDEVENVDFGTRVRIKQEIGPAVQHYAGLTGKVVGLRLYSMAKYVVALDDSNRSVFFCGNELEKI